MMSRTLLNRIVRRRRQRGAAMIEAAIVIPVLCIFIGLIVFTHRSYSTKIEKQTATRAGTLYYASHACEGQLPADVSSQIDDQDVGAGGSAASKNSGKIGGTNSAGATSALSNQGAMAKATPPPTTVTGTAVQEQRTVNLSRQITAGSEVACNEKEYPSKWMAVFGEIGSMWKSAGGLSQ